MALTRTACRARRSWTPVVLGFAAAFAVLLLVTFGARIIVNSALTATSTAATASSFAPTLEYSYDSPWQPATATHPGGDAATTPTATSGSATLIATASAVTGTRSLTASDSLRRATKGRLSRGERLGEFFRRLDRGDAPTNADDALSHVNRTLDEVEDELSGIPRNPNPGLEPDGRMYPPQADDITRHADRSITAVSRGHRTQIGSNGSITITTHDGTVVYLRAGGG